MAEDDAVAEAEARALEPWFAAARAESAEPPLALYSAILGDAAAVAAERRPPLPRREQPVAHGGGGISGIGGWKGLTALAACAAVGFWIGIAGQVTIENGAVWSGAKTLASDATPDDPVGAFFDLASAEG